MGPEAGSADWEALARYLAGESSPAEAAAMRDWLAANPARAELVSTLERSVGRLAYRAPADLDVEAALRRVHARMDEPVVHALPARGAPAAAPAAPARRRWLTPGALRAAAAVVVLAGAGAMWRARQGDDDALTTLPPPVAHVYMTSTGQRDSVRLPDGSLAVLGADSRLTVPTGFGDSAPRTVRLQGEAYFEVRHDEAKPFTVQAGGASIRDIGTAFAVRTGEGGAVRVSVTEGVVALAAGESAAADQGVILRQGDRGVLEAGARTPVAQPGGASADDLAWMSGRLVFREAPLSQVRADLRRWHGVELVVADSTFAGRHLTASFAGEPTERVLGVIGMALGARIVLRGDTAVLQSPTAGARTR